MGFYNRIRDWTDKRIAASGSARYLAALPLVPFLPLIFLSDSFPATYRTAIYAVAAACFIVWNGIVIWRGVRLTRASSLISDRAYDREGKYALPPEYAYTESSTAARQRVRKGSSKSDR